MFNKSYNSGTLWPWDDDEEDDPEDRIWDDWLGL